MTVAAAGAPGVFRHGKHVFEVNAALVKLVENDLRGHQLDGRRRIHRLVGVLFEQHRAALVILDQRDRRRGLERLRARRAASERDEDSADQPRS